MKNVIYFKEIDYTSQVCPYVFINTRLELLYEITKILIYKNRLEFIKINENEIPFKKGINIIGLHTLELNIVFDELTETNLCPHVFKDIVILQLIGSLYRIQKDLFGSFTKLEYIFLKFDNLKEFFHQGLEWTSYLKRNQTQDNTGLNDDDDDDDEANKISFIILTEFFIQGITSKYIYPNEDLCLFKDFPHKQLVIPSIYSLEEIECSCTLIWLMQNYKIIVEHSKTSFKFKVDFENFFQNFSIFQCMNNYTFLYESCRFDEKFNNCKKTSSARDKIDYGLFQIVFFLNWLKLVVEVYAKTFLCILGLITNLLVMMVIKNKSEKNITKKPFQVFL